MWFQFSPGEDIISIERQVFQSEWTNSEGLNFFRAPDHFKDKLVLEGGCRALALPPEGVPDNLPDIIFQEPKVDGSDSQMQALEALLSEERITSSSLRAELAAKLHECDALKLQVYELTEELNELKERLDDEDEK